ncbi:hypothetical protein [Haloferax gibbonsii]|nr:hypothetical protein [Haloferax gibbonsii]
MEVDDLDVNQIIDYRKQYAYGGNFSGLASRLNTELRTSPYTAQVESGYDISKLKAIIEEDQVSLPLVELHVDYFEEISEYEVQPGQFNKKETPNVIAALITNGEVLYWDPIYDYLNSETPRNKELRLSESVFLELWSRQNSARWTFWIDRQDQETLPSYQGDDQ